MPYTQNTLAQLIDQTAELMDDPGMVFWTPAEITLAIYEYLRVFGSLTSLWRSRGTFQVSPSDTSPFYNLSTEIALLRSRTTTVNSIVKEIQYHLLEFPSGIDGAQGSGQVS